MKDYYKNKDVWARITEFLGGPPLEQATSIFLTASGRTTNYDFTPRLLNEIGNYPEAELDIGRSLWDRESLLVHLDIEYVNFDFPAEPYLNPERTFDIQQSVEYTIERILLEYGIAPLHLLSGRGHHFVWSVRQDSDAFVQLSLLGRIPEHLKELYNKPHPPVNEPIELALGNAFSGLGLVMEFIAHRIKKEASPLCNIPVEITEVLVGQGNRGREIVCIDISEYGDPLYTRMVRVPFSFYFKPWQRANIFGWQAVDKLPLMFMIPLHEINAKQGIHIMRDDIQVIALASRATAQIPDQSRQTERLIAAYTASNLAEFHNWFYSQEQEPSDKWPQTYDRLPMDILPPCVAHILKNPNDLLLKPVVIEHIVRVMLSLGWHPRHIAGLIRSKYERDYGWGDNWFMYDAGTRADFYTRVFSGLFVTGLDDAIDFNSKSAKEKQLCFNSDCQHSLELFRESVVERRSYGRLANRPINRLFLPHQYL